MIRVAKLSSSFIMMASIFFIMGTSKSLINIILTFIFIIALVCISWALFTYIKKSVYIRLILLIGGFIYIYSRDTKDIIVLSYIMVVFLVLGLIHALIEIVFLKKSKYFREGLKILFKKVSNYNTVIVISFIIQFLSDFVFHKVYRDFYIDYSEILITILIYYLIMEFSMLRGKKEKPVEDCL